jgi:hypothetical protein
MNSNTISEGTVEDDDNPSVNAQRDPIIVYIRGDVIPNFVVVTGKNVIALIILIMIGVRIFGLVNEYHTLNECGEFELWMFTLARVIHSVILLMKKQWGEHDKGVLLGFAVWECVLVFFTSECAHRTILYKFIFISTLTGFFALFFSILLVLCYYIMK